MSRFYDARHMSSNNDYQPQMTNWFDIQIQGISEDISFQAVGVDLPTVSNDVVRLPYGNTEAKVAGRADMGSSGSLSIRDSITKDVERQLLEWQSQVYNPETGTMGWVEDYKRDMIVTQYGPDGTHERVWKFEGVWPSSINYGRMDHGRADAKELQITLQYDASYRD